MWMRTARNSVVVLVGVAVLWMAGQAWGIGFILGQTKEELRLKYDLAVSEADLPERGILVTVVLTIADEGRLTPLDEVQLVVPEKKKDRPGGYGADLVVSIDMRKSADGKRVGRVQFLRELAERAELQLNTYTLDGKTDRSTRLHHVIPIGKHLAPAPPRRHNLKRGSDCVALPRSRGQNGKYRLDLSRCARGARHRRFGGYFPAESAAQMSLMVCSVLEPSGQASLRVFAQYQRGPPLFRRG